MSYSQIAAALARSRGKAASTPPPEDPAAPPPVEAALGYSFSLKPYAGAPRPAKTFPWGLALCGVALASVAGGAAWWLVGAGHSPRLRFPLCRCRPSNRPPSPPWR